MQRKPTSNTRGPNAIEKRFQTYTKESDCIVCGNPGPSIVDHVMGATYRDQKTLIGHLFVIPLCMECDTVKTQGSRRGFCQAFGVTFSDLWLRHAINYQDSAELPEREVQVIADCGK